MTELIVNAFNGKNVRSQTIDGEAIFAAKDVCEILGISKYRDAIRSLDDDERVSIFADTPGGKQEMQGVNKFGIHSLVLKSNKPEAKTFKRWIVHEILPAIEKTGSYGSPSGAVAQALATNIDYLTTRLKEAEADSLTFFGISLDNAFTNVIMFTSVSDLKGGAASRQNESLRASGFRKMSGHDSKKKQMNLVLPCRNTFECGSKTLRNSKESRARLTKSGTDYPYPRNEKATRLTLQVTTSSNVQ